MTLTRPFISEEALRNAMHPDNRKKFDSKEVRLSAIGTCQKKQVLGALEGMDPIAWQYDQGGHILQQALADMLRTQGHNILEEVEVKHPFGFAHIDIIIRSPEYGKGYTAQHIIECKTIRCSGFQYSLPKENNVLQVKGQMMFLEEEQGFPPTAEIIYMCRDHMGEHFKAFTVPFPTLKERLDIRKRLQTVAQSIANNYTPDKPFEKPQWECGWKTREGGELKEIRCPFWDRCWEKEPAKPPVPVREVTDEKEAEPIRMLYKAKQLIEEGNAMKEAWENKAVMQFGDFQKVQWANLTLSRSVRKRVSVDWKQLAFGNGVPQDVNTEPYEKSFEYESFVLRESK